MPKLWSTRLRLSRPWRIFQNALRVRVGFDRRAARLSRPTRHTRTTKLDFIASRSARDCRSMQASNHGLVPCLAGPIVRLCLRLWRLIGLPVRTMDVLVSAPAHPRRG